MSVRHLILLAASASPALAAEGSAPPDLGGSLISMFLGLALVVAMLLAGLWLLRRLAEPRGVPPGTLKVLAATAVGSRERVVIVEVGKSCLVLGVAPGRITALTEIPRDDIPALPPNKEGGTFSSRLRQALERHAR